MFVVGVAIRWGILAGNDTVYASLGTMAEAFGRDRSTIKNYLKGAIERDLMTLVHGPRRQPDGSLGPAEYRVNLSWQEAVEALGASGVDLEEARR